MRLSELPRRWRADRATTGRLLQVPALVVEAMGSGEEDARAERLA